MKKSPQFPGIPDGVPKPPMPMLNRLVRQAPEAPAPPSGFMLAASELAYENGAPSARIVRSISFHSEYSKQVHLN